MYYQSKKIHLSTCIYKDMYLHKDTVMPVYIFKHVQKLKDAKVIKHAIRNIRKEPQARREEANGDLRGLKQLC